MRISNLLPLRQMLTANETAARQATAKAVQLADRQRDAAQQQPTPPGGHGYG